ncbi:hypothetical protein Noda2021_12520 [Candidatus Dependentiae bacterium Noda2021]|nr:hypothetical protein Noda2021_12520 [Candidatus Dependentiae bacterium Noda2021]
MKKIVIIALTLVNIISADASISAPCNMAQVRKWVVGKILSQRAEMQEMLFDLVTICGEPKVLKIIDQQSINKNIVLMEKYIAQLKTLAEGCQAEIEEKAQQAAYYNLKNFQAWKKQEHTNCWVMHSQLVCKLESLKIALRHLHHAQNRKS